jgi:acetyltransferase-like isoleucine patch superfamily enzyme
MKLIRFATILVRQFGKELLSILRYVRILYLFPEIQIRWPINIYYDDIHAVKIGKDSSIGIFSEIIALKRVKESKVHGELIIGERVVIGSHANIRAAGGVIHIGQNTIIGQHVSLIAANHSIGDTSPYRDLPWDENKTGVIINENAWIGAGSIILPGSKIGRNSVVAAGSVVTGSVPDNEIWSGVPARRLKILKK